MANFEEVKKEINNRGDTVSPILPGACWISLSGNFTPKELRAIAKEVEDNFAKMMKFNVNKN